MNNNIDKDITPLRNSDLASKPYRSPLFNSNSTYEHNKLSELNSLPFLCSKSISPHVLSSSQENGIERKRLDFMAYKPVNSSYLSENDLFVLKRRIRNKILGIDNLLTKLAYRKKHNTEGLKIEISKWQLALQRTLLQYKEDCKGKFIGASTWDMKRIICMLGISESSVKFVDVEKIT